ncbi:MAG: adenylosuccinate lyase, partial [Leptolyngbyaceae bacterium]|nr:adenylosuccinate lyase [Leptolyngbyaceae bacterium]
NCYGGVVFSQRVLLTLVDSGMGREDAYRVVQSCAHEAWNNPEGNFQALIAEHPEVKERLSEAQVHECFDPKHHLQNLEKIYARLNI